MNSFNPSGFGLKVTLLSFDKDGFGIKWPKKVGLPLNKETKLNQTNEF